MPKYIRFVRKCSRKSKSIFFKNFDFKMISVLWRCLWPASGGPKILVYIYIYINKPRNKKNIYLYIRTFKYIYLYIRIRLYIFPYHGDQLGPQIPKHLKQMVSTKIVHTSGSFFLMFEKRSKIHLTYVPI